MPKESTAAVLYESLLSDVHRMIAICEQQQGLVLNGQLEDLAETMAERETLVSAMSEKYAKLSMMSKDMQDSGDDSHTVGLRRQMEESIEQYLHLDQVMQHLLAKKGERMVTELLDRFKAVNGIAEYRQVNEATDLIARIFPGNSRRFDEKF